MVIKTKIAVLSTALLVSFLYVSPQADAQRGRSVSNASRAIRAAGNITKAPAIRAMQGGGNHNRGGSPFPILDAISRASHNGGGGGGHHNNNNTPFPLLNALSQIDNGHHNGGNGHNGGKNHGSNPWDFLYGLSQAAGYGPGYGHGYPGGGYGYGGGYGGYPNNYDSYYQHKSDEEYADAIRDSAIAGAVGNVVSAIVSSPMVRTPVPVYAQPAPVYTQPAPVYVQPSPLGRYETRREVVGGGYYERQQIWVPEVSDPRSGSVVEGHYENVKKWVPEVIQETQVWVAP